jgi:hypothetical protein
MVPEVWGLVVTFLMVREAHTICRTCTTLLRAARVTVMCLGHQGKNNCCLSSPTTMISIDTLHVHESVGHSVIQRILRRVSRTTTCSLRRLDDVLVTSLEHCNVDVHVINQAQASTQQPKWIEKSATVGGRRMVCHFENSTVSVAHIAAIRVALEKRVGFFVMRLRQCNIKLGRYSYEGPCTHICVFRLELTSTNDHRSLGNRSVTTYLILDCLLHQLQAPCIREFTLSIEEGLLATDWIGCMNVLIAFLSQVTTTASLRVCVRFIGLDCRLLGHFGFEYTIRSFLGLVGTTVTLSLYFRSVSKAALCGLGFRLQDNISGATFSLMEDGVVFHRG